MRPLCRRLARSAWVSLAGLFASGLEVCAERGPSGLGSAFVVGLRESVYGEW